MRPPESRRGRRPLPLARRTIARAVLAVIGTLGPAFALAVGLSGGGGLAGPAFGAGSSGFGGGSPIDRAFGLGVIGAAPDGEAGAREGGWTFTSGVALSATYSDNADLASAGTDKQEELFLQVLPYFTLTGEGARVRAQGYYAPALYTGTIGDTPANIDNFLSFNGTVEVTPDTFFVDGFATASVVNQNASGRSGGIPTTSYLYNSDDLTQAFGIGVSPYVRHRLGSSADFLARATVSTTNFADSSANNSVNAAFTAGFTSGTSFQRLPWSVTYSLSRIEFNEASATSDDSNTYQEIIGRTSYVISPVWRIDGSLGYVDNDYQTTSGNTSGGTWSLGGTWTPNPRIALSLGYGGQPYGENWYLNSRYAHKRVSWFANYSSQLTTVQQEFLQSPTFVQTTPGGLPVVDPATGLPVAVTRLDPTLTNESYVLSRFLTGVNWTGNRTTVGLDATWNERDYQVSGGTQRDWGIGARVSRTLSADLTATARLGWTSYEDDGDVPLGGGVTGESDDEDGWDAGLLLTRRLSQRSSVSGIYSYRSNLGATGLDTLGTTGGSGSENRLTLVFNHTF
jgi:uncharacterized protein (PEP-CTERM system associated)